ncbi:erythromycin biosynthesis sensory transduction protein eryC1 [Oceanidesulfovibrio indonesiensis]|uniref:Erythromycin biosynthesis sensory transduction protein eryC1 n=2 Tax=Oceanidesulfovibrio indonesiensis TaxID=54767 RepID=A0A7M3MC44_9BACT|nr:erythromycin biosynthesis sensory transduction protein eryC1 [Oceanidesulfovibrio indonesiensis]
MGAGRLEALDGVWALPGLVAVIHIPSHISSNRDYAVEMKIPMNDLSRAYRDSQAIFDDLLTKVGASGYYLNGPYSKAFSREFAEYVGTPHCLLVGNGSDALELALRAAGVEAGDRVVTVANAGGYTTVACRIIGAVPVYADIDPDTLLMDVDDAASLIDPSVRAVVVTHLFGAMVDVEALRSRVAALGKHCPVIVEDCAQAHGASIRGQRAGSFAELATFSFYPTKNLGAFGDGGAVLCRDGAFMDRLSQLHQYGWSKKYHVSVPLGRNSRMDEIQAAVLSARLPGLEDANAARRAVIDSYAAAAPASVAFPKRPDQIPVAHLAVVMVEDRDGFRAHLAEQGIGTDIHYPVLDCDQPGWGELPQVCGQLPNSRRRLNEIVSLPCFPELTHAEISRVAEALAAYAP